MLVSIQGIKGSYHHDVACALYGEEVSVLECLSFDKLEITMNNNEGFLKLEAQFPKETLNPGGSVQGGQMNSLLDDVTSLILIYESKGTIYPSSINLHSHHHRPLFGGKVIATAEIIKRGKNITTIKGELYDLNGKLATTLMHTVFLIKSDFDLK